MRTFLGLLSVASAAVAIDFVSTDGYFSYSPTTPGVWSEFSISIGSGCGSKTAIGPDGEGSFTFTFPQASTSFEWFGFPGITAGAVTVCFDGQTGSSCDTASYFNASGGPIVSLYRKTGLSNALHTVTVTNIADPSHGNQFGQITLDKVALEGSTRAPPSFPADSFLTEIPLVIGPNGAVLVNPLIGSGPAGTHGESLPSLLSNSLTKGFLSLALMDTGAAGSWFVWSGCTDPLCAGHASYTPSPTAYNFSIVDTQLYTVNAEEFDSWRMNDTLTYGNVSTPITFGAAFELPNSQNVDGNMGFAKTYFVGGPCAGFYTGFVEDAYLNGAIKNAVAAYYLVRIIFKPISHKSRITYYSQDQTSGGGVVQVGGIDRNKYTGAVDWILMDNDSKWRSLKQQRTVKSSSTATPFNATGYFPIDSFVFDTGYSGGLWVPHEDFTMLLEVAGAKQDGQGNWEFPCESVMTFNFLGSQGVTYTIPLANTNFPGTFSGYCYANAQDGQDSPDWFVSQISTTYVGLLIHSTFTGLPGQDFSTTIT
jgi:hypothetical protein